MSIIKKLTIFFIHAGIITSLSCSFKTVLQPDNTADEKTINNSINDYSSGNWHIRIEAVKRASGYINTVYAGKILNLMLLASADYHPAIQIEAIKSLRQMKSYAALEKLREIAMTDPDLNVRRTAITALHDYSSADNSDIFITGTGSRDWLIREASFIGLLKIKPEELQLNYLGKIIKGIKDPRLSVKLAVLTNLKIKDPLLYNEISGIINNKRTGISLLKGALTAINGYTFDERTRNRLLSLLTHRNKDIRILSLQALKREKIELNF
ncbi:MAG TPA: HEAT repeat domain-containing protein [Spirochaetota bacterium]|nr:HEAT repeat domain-containing protein [Spirochaetota bacterium]HPF05946.1 HEAT repeat domain-containing protein [Spirochaetota bacterium]HPJ42450.1 HEAT repeat domain-containing protein [Spirochaetota bacterium]HPR37220.1 HEAT repeat domain-containing protein [Spirochaetota bacterium]HRX46424.1 HEAT repeat domain-containing protein [Spirochaetota bacterium]